MKTSSRSSNHSRLTLFLFLLVVVSMPGLNSFGADTDEQDAALAIPRSALTPRIDGELQPEEWDGVFHVSDFRTVIPSAGKSPKNSSIVYFTYDSETLYIAFQFMKASPVVSYQIERDHNLAIEDAFAFAVDTYGDNQAAYVFGINAINAQTDFLVTKAGESQNLGWDSQWKSATQVHDNYWAGEIAIPLTSLRFDADRETPWGINFMRIDMVGDNNILELTSWAPVGDKMFNIAGYRQFMPQVKLSSDRKARITPTAVYRNTNHLNSGGRVRRDEVDFGGDANIPFGKSIDLDITYNPDFSQVEADVDQIDLSRTYIRLEEKRPFFYNGLEAFDTPVNLFYTRNIENVVLGSKLRGTSRGVHFVFFNTIREDSGLTLHPSFSEQSYNTAFRAKTSVGRTIESGFLLVSDYDFNGNYNHVVSLDSYAELPNALSASAQLYGSFTRWLPDRNTTGYYLSLKRIPDGVGFNFTLLHGIIGDNFHSETGLYYRNDFTQNYVSVGYSFEVPGRLFDIAKFRAAYDHWGTYDKMLPFHDRSFLKDEYYASFNIVFENGMSFFASADTYARRYSKVYKNTIGTLYFSSNATVSKGISVNYTFGEYYDSYLHYPSASLFIEPINRMLLKTGVEYFRRQFDSVHVEQWLAYQRIAYRIKPDLWVRAFFQSSDFTRQIDGNVMVQYDFSVTSRAYIVYNETRNLTGNDWFDAGFFPDSELADRTVLIKVAYDFYVGL